MRLIFKCPVCSELLQADGKTLKCKNNHCFDVAKQGYVNLLQSQKSSKKRHGDDSLMVKARQDFLDAGYYECLRDRVTQILRAFSKKEMTVADLGCGECYYTAQMLKVLTQQGIDCDIYGIDISKQALISGAKRCKQLHLAVASTSDLPLEDSSCDAVVSIFAPCSEQEIYRVLKADGVWIKAYPLERHLMSLKSVIYDEPYENKVCRTAPDGFETVKYDEVKGVYRVEGKENIMNLFKMTPYYYKTGIADQQKLASREYIETEFEFGVSVFAKSKI